jgi:hypothetical protein
LLQALVSKRQASGNEDFMDVSQDGGDEEDEYDDPDSGDEEYGDLIYASEVSVIADAYHESCESSHELLDHLLILPPPYLSVLHLQGNEYVLVTIIMYM